MEKFPFNSIAALSMAIFLSFTSNSSANYTYSDMYVFGDSLSDSGNLGTASRFVAAGELDKNYNESLSLQYTSKMILPRIQGGNNFAQSGGNTYTTQGQVDEYLNITQGQGDPDALYVLWAGSNDLLHIAGHQIMNFANDMYDVFAIETGFNSILSAIMGNSPLDITQSQNNIIHQLSQIFSTGANIVVVPNLPYNNYTPLTNFLITEIAELMSGQQLSERLYKILADKQFTNEEERRKSIIDANHEAIFGIVPIFPREVIEVFYDGVFNIQKSLIDRYNTEMETSLQQFNKDIVRLDVNRVLQEAMFDSKGYGFDVSLVPQCSIKVSGADCQYSEATFNQEQVSSFSDSMHPTGVIHKIFADYMMSVLDAPYYVIALSETLESLRDKPGRILNTHLQDTRLNETIHKWSIFGGFTGNLNSNQKVSMIAKEKLKTDSGTFGVSTQLNPGWRVGAALTIDYGNYARGNHFKFDYRAVDALLFASYRHKSNVWGSANIYYSWADFDDITRKFTLNTKFRRESGETTGTAYGLQAKIGYDYWLTPFIVTGPIIGIDAGKITIADYQEQGTSSTGMKFEKQNYNRTQGSIGWHINAKTAWINPYLQLDYNYNLTQKERVARGAIHATETSFSRSKVEGNNGWVQATTGANISLNKETKLHAGLAYSTQNRADNFQYTLSVSHTF